MPLVAGKVHGLLSVNEHYHYHHKAEAFAVLHKAPAKQKNAGGFCDVHNGKTRGRPTADRFKNSLNKRQLAGDHKRQRADNYSPKPREQDRQAALLLFVLSVRFVTGVSFYRQSEHRAGN